MAMSRDGLLPSVFRAVHPVYRTPHVTTIVTGIVVALGASFLDDDETYDLTNIGTLFAFAVVCVAVMVLRHRRPESPRKFLMPAMWVLAPAGIVGCVWFALGLPWLTWIRFVVWLAIGLAIYFAYGARKSALQNGDA